MTSRRHTGIHNLQAVGTGKLQCTYSTCDACKLYSWTAVSRLSSQSVLSLRGDHCLSSALDLCCQLAAFVMHHTARQLSSWSGQSARACHTQRVTGQPTQLRLMCNWPPATSHPLQTVLLVVVHTTMTMRSQPLLTQVHKTLSPYLRGIWHCLLQRVTIVHCLRCVCCRSPCTLPCSSVHRRPPFLTSPFLNA
jgi:hypothetical protein